MSWRKLRGIDISKRAALAGATTLAGLSPKESRQLPPQTWKGGPEVDQLSVQFLVVIDLPSWSLSESIVLC